MDLEWGVGAVVEQKPGQCLGGPLGQVFAWRLVGRMRQVQKALALARPPLRKGSSKA